MQHCLLLNSVLKVPTIFLLLHNTIDTVKKYPMHTLTNYYKSVLYMYTGNEFLHLFRDCFIVMCKGTIGI